MTSFFAGLQWLGFMFANTVVIPLSIGSAFHLSSQDIAGALARSFLITGIACLLQVMIGHRWPLMEGQSGMWWGVLLGMAQIGQAEHIPLTVVGGSIAAGTILGGVLVILCGVLGLHRLLKWLFTPIVMAVLLFLLAAQLIDIFFRGMLGLSSGHLSLEPRTTVLSLLLVLLVSILTIAGRGIISNFAILIGIAVGWVLYAIFIGNTPIVIPSVHEVGHWFTLGPIAWNSGILVTCVVTALLNTTNTVATLKAAEPLFGKPTTDGQMKRSLVLSGFYTVLSGTTGLVPYAPYTSSIGFLRTTRLLATIPFIIGAILFALFGLIPPVSGFFATLPVAVGDSVLLVAYLQLFGSALLNLKHYEFDFRTIFRIALPTLLGLAIQNAPSDTFATLPGPVQPLCSNGMLIGILLSIILERLRWQREA